MVRYFRANTQNYNPSSGQLTSTTEFRRLAIPNFSTVECVGNTSPTYVSNIHVVNVVPSFTATPLTSSPNPAEFVIVNHLHFLLLQRYQVPLDEFLVNDISKVRLVHLEP